MAYQFFDFLFLQEVEKYLKEKVNSLLERIAAKDDFIVLRFFNIERSKPFSLVISTCQGNPFVLPLEKNLPSLSEEVPAFFQKLNRYLKNSRLLKVDRRNLSLSLYFKTLDQKHSLMELVFELDTKYSNIFLLNEKKEILTLKNPTGERDLEVGDIYQPPVLTKFSLQDDITPSVREKFRDLKDRFNFLEKVYLSLFYDLSFFHYCSLGITLEDDLDRVQRKFREALDKSYTFYAVEAGSTFSAIVKAVDDPLIDFSKWKRVDSLSAFAYIFLEQLEKEKRENFKKTLRKKLKRKLQGLQKHLKRLQADPPSLEKAQKYLEWGNSLLSSGNLNKRVTEEKISLFNYFTGKEEEVLTEKGITIKGLADLFFQRHKREKRKSLHYEKEKENLERKIAYWIEVLFLIEEEENLEELYYLEKTLFRKGKFPKLQKEKKKKLKCEKQILKDDAGREWEVYIGKSVRQNEYLLQNIANREDFWFHAFEVPGGHIIVKNPEKQGEPPREILFQAGLLAKKFSRYKNDSQAIIAWTRVKYLKKPPQRSPGFVIMERFSTFKIKE